jgi:hypothetical protein
MVFGATKGENKIKMIKTDKSSKIYAYILIFSCSPRKSIVEEGVYGLKGRV